MFHITQLSTAEAQMHLQLEGDLDRDHVEALRQLIGIAGPAAIARLVLHCGLIRRADDDGLRFLIALRRNGVALQDVPFQIDWKLSQLDYKLRSHA
jgi:hypothetical protein